MQSSGPTADHHLFVKQSQKAFQRIFAHTHTHTHLGVFLSNIAAQATRPKNI